MNAAHELCENAYAKFWVSDGILYFTYKPQVVIDLNVAERVVADRLLFQNEKSYPILCDIRGVIATEKAGRDYLAQYGSTMTKAVALLSNQRVLNTISNFYLRVSKPSSPTKLFMDEALALDFLKPFV